MLEALEQGYNVALTADVPKVARVAGLGVVKLAQHSGRPIYAGGDRHAAAVIELDNWDRSAINLPFGRIAVAASEPIYVPRDADSAALEAARQRGGERTQPADRARLRNRRSQGERAIVSDRLPAALRAYRMFSVAMTPLTPLFLARRLRRGKEHGVRLPERRGVSAMARPPGPLVWLHGASVGELISVLPLIERIHARESQRAGDLRHGHLGRTRRAAAAARRHPSIRADRRAVVRAPFPRSLAARSGAVRGIRAVAEHHDRDVAARRADDPGQRAAVGKLVPALALFAGVHRRPAAAGSICAWRARRPTPSD